MSALNTFFNWRTSRNTSAMRQQPMSVERNAESKHESRHGVRWVLFGCLAVSGLAIQGAGSLWYLVPIGAVLALVHVASAQGEAGASDEELLRRSARRQITARAAWVPSTGCGWCGSAAWHKDDARRAQTPAQFHAVEIDAAVQAAVAAGAVPPR